MKCLIAVFLLAASAALAADAPKPGGSGKPGEAPSPAADKQGGSHCKVLDETGTLVVEHDSDGTTLKCQGEIREKVKAARCAPGKQLSYQYIGESSPGKEGKPVAMNITCPKS